MLLGVAKQANAQCQFSTFFFYLEDGQLCFFSLDDATACLDHMTKGGVLYLVFYPRTRPRTSLQCFALDSRCSEAKHCRDVLGRVLGRVLG